MWFQLDRLDSEVKYSTHPYAKSVERFTIFRHAFQNNHKHLDPSFKTDLDLWDCLGRVILIL